MTVTIQQIVDAQTQKTLKKGERLGRFDQIRQRHFWSSYLFVADPTTCKVSAGTYDIFKTVPGASGQGYPTNVNLTLRETNWLNPGRVPDNQSFAITEIGATIRKPPLENASSINSSGIFASLTTAQRTFLTPGLPRQLSALDANNIAFGTVLEMSFLTNNVPIGLIGDFSQSAGILSPASQWAPLETANDSGLSGVSNGIPCAAFRRKFKIPILLSSGENMGMRLTVPRDIQLMHPRSAVVEGDYLGAHGTGWYEIRVDWWAIESFVEKS